MTNWSVPESQQRAKYLSRNKTVKLENQQSGFRRKVLDKVEGTLIDANDR